MKFSASLVYNFLDKKDAINAIEKLTSTAQSVENEFIYEYSTENTKLIVNVKACSSDKLRVGMNIIFPLIEAIDQEVRSK